MTWEDFYDKFYEWADSTQVRKISELTTFGSHDQVAEVILMYVNEKDALRLARKALAAGVRFTPAEIVEMDGSVSKDCMNQMVMTVLGDFTQEQVEELTYSIDDDLQADLEKRYCHYEYDDDMQIEEPEETRRQKKPGKLFGLFALAGMASELGGQKKTPRFRVGDHVRVRRRDQEGTIIDINGGLYRVSLNDGRTVDSFPESDLERAW